MPAAIFVVPEGSPERADKLLARHFPKLSRSAIQRAIESGKTRRENGQLLVPKQKLVPGDVLAIDFTPEPHALLRPVEIPLELLYEDEHLLVLNKASGMVVHPGEGTGEDTLVHALLFHCGDALSSIGAPQRPGIVHRLDKETSGVMVVAKSDESHHRLVAQFSERHTAKSYLALVTGVPAKDKGSLEGAIGRHPVVRVKMAVSEHGKPARTDWRLQESFGEGHALLSCDIHTGRTHQIRVHLSHLGHPVVGDKTYGYKPGRRPGPLPPRILLHAKTLSFLHPASREEVVFEAPLPEDFEAYLSALREQFGGDPIT